MKFNNLERKGNFKMRYTTIQTLTNVYGTKLIQSTSVHL